MAAASPPCGAEPLFVRLGRMPPKRFSKNCVFRPIVTAHFGIVTARFGRM
jgi:hypothetical protein